MPFSVCLYASRLALAFKRARGDAKTFISLFHFCQLGSGGILNDPKPATSAVISNPSVYETSVCCGVFCLFACLLAFILK